MYNNITTSKTMVGSTRNPDLPGRMAGNSLGILVFLVELPGIHQEDKDSWGFLQEYVEQGKVLGYGYGFGISYPSRNRTHTHSSMGIYDYYICANILHL